MTPSQLMPWDPCKVCGEPTTRYRSQLCSACWELKVRIEERPDVAVKLLRIGGHATSLFKDADDASRLRYPDTLGQ